MSDELLELDQLIESDILDALGQEVPKDENTADAPIEIEQISNDTDEDEVLIEDFLEENDSEETGITQEEVEAEFDKINIGENGEINYDTDEQNTSTGDEEEIDEKALEEEWASSLNIEENQAKEIESSDVTQNELKDVSMNTDSLASLLSQLLNNKTIEITIKIKD